jgi:hypothetical protein
MVNRLRVIIRRYLNNLKFLKRYTAPYKNPASFIPGFCLIPTSNIHHRVASFSSQVQEILTSTYLGHAQRGCSLCNNVRKLEMRPSSSAAYPTSSRPWIVNSRDGKFEAPVVALLDDARWRWAASSSSRDVLREQKARVALQYLRGHMVLPSTSFYVTCNVHQRVIGMRDVRQHSGARLGRMWKGL